MRDHIGDLQPGVVDQIFGPHRADQNLVQIHEAIVSQKCLEEWMLRLQIAYDKVERRVELSATVSEAVADAFENAPISGLFRNEPRVGRRTARFASRGRFRTA